VAVNGANVFFTVPSAKAIGRVNQEHQPPPFALIGWAPKPVAGLAAAPIGIFEATAAEQLIGWTLQANASARGGKILSATAASSLAASATWPIDPATMVPDSFSGELTLEVWARVLVTSALVQPMLTAQVQPQDGAGFGGARYTDEWSSEGRPLTLPSAANGGGIQSAFRFTRLGTLHCVVNPLAPRVWNLVVEGRCEGGGIGQWGPNYLMLVPSLSRACSPSGKVHSAGYPRFISNVLPTVKAVRSDLSAVVGKPGKNGHPDTGLGGQLLELPPGESTVALKLSSLVPDDPTVTFATEQLSHEAKVTVWVTPRWYLARTA
jgi:hypothetical protein